jgi:hypothetical protein
MLCGISAFFAFSAVQLCALIQNAELGSDAPEFRGTEFAKDSAFGLTRIAKRPTKSTEIAQQAVSFSP